MLMDILRAGLEQTDLRRQSKATRTNFRGWLRGQVQCLASTLALELSVGEVGGHGQRALTAHPGAVTDEFSIHYPIVLLGHHHLHYKERNKIQLHKVRYRLNINHMGIKQWHSGW